VFTKSFTYTGFSAKESTIVVRLARAARVSARSAVHVSDVQCCQFRRF